MGDNDRGFSRDGDRGGDRGGYRDREREAPKERPRLNLAPRSKEVAESGDGPSSATSSIFGGAKPVDTLKKEREIEDKLERRGEEPKKTRPSAASIFGGAKPVDTTAREREIEQKLNKMSVGDEAEKGAESGEKDDHFEAAPAPTENAWRRKPDLKTGDEPKSSSAYKPPVRRDDRRDEGRDERRDDYRRDDRRDERRD